MTQSGYGAFESTVTQALQSYDRTSKGLISFKDFQEISSTNFDPFASEAAIKSIFKEFDKNDQGFIYPDDLVNAAEGFKMNLLPKEAAKIIESMDYNQDGAVDLEEFKSVVKV